MLTFETIYGEIQAPEWSSDLILKSLSQYGEWSYCEQLLIAPLLRSGDVLWDCGAFLGTFGIGVAQLAHKDGRCPSRIVAIEPGSELGPHLQANLLRNSPCDYEVASIAVGPESGKLEPAISTDTDNIENITNHGAVAYRIVSGDTGRVAIESQALWQLRQSFGSYDVIKLDIEGMESDALRDDFDFLKNNKPLIWAECNEALSSVKLLEVLVAAGYQPLYVAFPAFRRVSFHGEVPALFPMAYEAVLLASPPDRLSSFDPTSGGEEVIVRPVCTSWDLRQALWLTPRWATPEWTQMSRPELIALLGRLARGIDLGVFLNDRL